MSYKIRSVVARRSHNSEMILTSGANQILSFNACTYKVAAIICPTLDCRLQFTSRCRSM